MRRIELRTFQRVKHGHEKDYCVYHGLLGMSVDFGGGYKRLFAAAKRLSRHIGEEKVGYTEYKETEQLIKGMAAVCVETYSYTKNVLDFIEMDFFDNGEYIYTLKDSFTPKRETSMYVKSAQFSKCASEKI